MYAFVSALLRKKGVNQTYSNVDISQVAMTELFTTYRDGYVEFSNPSLRNTFVKFTDLKRLALPATSGTLTDWLVRIGNRSIPGSIVKPDLTEKNVWFSDAFQSGFTVNRAHPVVADTTGFPISALTDLYIYKSIAEMNLIKQNTLTTVNGLLHINIPRDNGLLIKQGGETVRIANDNHVGVLSFEDIGIVEQFMIQDSYIQPLPTDNISVSYRKSITLSLGKNLTNKTLLISFCGRLLPMDLYHYTENGSVIIDMYKIDILQTILDVRDKIDITSLDLEERDYYKYSVNTDSAVASDTTLKLLKLFQTFLIIVDSPNIAIEKLTVNNTALTNLCEVNFAAPHAYMDDKGFLQSFWRMNLDTSDYKTRRLYLPNRKHEKSIYLTGSLDNATWIVDQTEVDRPDRDIGHLVKISKSTMTFYDYPTF